MLGVDIKRAGCGRKWKLDHQHQEIAIFPKWTSQFSRLRPTPTSAVLVGGRKHRHVAIRRRTVNNSTLPYSRLIFAAELSGLFRSVHGQSWNKHRNSRRLGRDDMSAITAFWGAPLWSPLVCYHFSCTRVISIYIDVRMFLSFYWCVAEISNIDSKI